MRRKALVFFACLAIMFFILFPQMVCQGAKTGLLLWFQTVLPALLPFMILSNFLVRKNITEYISIMVAPVFSRIFSISGQACYPALIGMLSGYPIGAKTVAQMYEKEMLTRAEAQYLLCFCNNASPMFLMEYIGVECIHSDTPFFVIGIIYLSGFLGSLFERHKKGIKREQIKKNKNKAAISKKSSESVVAALDESILDAFVTITKVGGYIILFSIFAKIVDELLPFSAIMKCIVIGFLEITTGGSVLASAPLAPSVREATMIGLCAFGGFSGAAQTASVLSHTDLSVGRYLYVKVRQALIAWAICFVFLSFAR